MEQYTTRISTTTLATDLYRDARLVQVHCLDVLTTQLLWQFLQQLLTNLELPDHHLARQDDSVSPSGEAQGRLAPTPPVPLIRGPGKCTCTKTLEAPSYRGPNHLHCWPQPIVCSHIYAGM